jgi:ADP-heptose:LPS heptosyltransferase
MSFRIISTADRVVLPGGLVMQPFVRYVLPAGAAQILGMMLKKEGSEASMSVFNSYYHPYSANDLNGKRLAFYRHNAFGDQLMATAVPVYLKHLYPGAQIDVYAAPEVLDVWRGLPVRVYPAPLIFEAAKSYDYHLMYDQMLEENSERDQGNAYDDMFRFAGFRKVDDVFKRPKVVPEDNDYAELEALRGIEWMVGDYLVYQLSASNPNRTYPYEHGSEFIKIFLEAFPEWRVVVVGTDKDGEARLVLPRNNHDRVINLVNRTARFRSLIPLVQRAKMIVCPDSSIGHLAAAFPKVPVVSLWGLFSPQDRVRYYPNHHPLFPKEVCGYAPCHSHKFELPQKWCSKATNAEPGAQKWCNVLKAISPGIILSRVKDVLEAISNDV